MIDIVFDDAGELRALVLDATPEHRHRLSALVTEHERERGTNFVDHSRKERDVFSVDVVVTDTPLDGTADLTRCRDVWAQLEDVMTRALLCVVTTRIKTYREMALTEATTSVTAADGSWIRGQLTFQQCPTVSTELVDDPVPSRPRDRRQVEAGTSATEPAPELESFASQGLDAIFGGR